MYRNFFEHIHIIKFYWQMVRGKKRNGSEEWAGVPFEKGLKRDMETVSSRHILTISLHHSTSSDHYGSCDEYATIPKRPIYRPSCVDNDHCERTSSRCSKHSSIKRRHTSRYYPFLRSSNTCCYPRYG